MRFSRVFLNRLQNQPSANDTVVVIDVLRSFTTAAVALSRGASAIYPVEGVAAAAALAEMTPGALLVGAVAGGDPAPGFTFGNSPAALLSADLAGRPIVLSTAAGVRGLQRFRGVRRLFACGRYLESLLRGESPAPAAIARRVRNSDFGRRFGTVEWPNLPAADLDLAAMPDLFDFAMPARQTGDHLVIREGSADSSLNRGISAPVAVQAIVFSMAASSFTG